MEWQYSMSLSPSCVVSKKSPVCFLSLCGRLKTRGGGGGGGGVGQVGPILIWVAFAMYVANGEMFLTQF